MIANKYRIIEKLNEGSFGQIFKGENIRTKELVAIKIESKNNQKTTLKNEARIYQYLGKTDIAPNLKWYGTNESNNYLVINLLGKSLKSLLKNEKKLPLKNSLMIGIQIIEAIKYIHNKSLLHRDIKPDNFLLTINKPIKIYIIDFGISKPYIINNKHIEFKLTHQFIGTQNFASINSHEFYEQSRRDDLESLAYMLIYFYFGELEWNDGRITFLDKEEENNYVKNKKKNLVKNQAVPKIIMDYYKSILALSFEETPDYVQFIKKFKSELDKL